MIRGFYNVPKGISPKYNGILRLKFDLTYFDIEIQHVNNSATGNHNFTFFFCCF